MPAQPEKTESKDLLALMSILTQSLFTFVSSHLVALLFLSVWHDFKILKYCYYIMLFP